MNCRDAEVFVADEIDEVEQQLAKVNVSVRPRLAISHGRGTHTLRSFSGVQSCERESLASSEQVGCRRS